jgi:outer membrane protein TolC
MKFNIITATIASLGLSVSTAFADTSLDDYIQDSIDGSYRIKSLEAAHQVELLRAEQEEKYYLPSFKVDHTTKTNTMDNPIGIKPWDSREHESNVNLRSNIWRDNHDEVYSMLSTKADASAMNVNIQKSNIRAQITTAVYSIFLYENLIREGEEILTKAKQIDSDIKNKVKGGLAKASDATTAEVLITDMENAILATRLKIKQLRLNLEQVSGVPYPEDMVVDMKSVNTLLAKIPKKSIDNNKTLLKKSLETKAKSLSIGASENWVSVDVFAKTKANNLTFDRSETEVGVMVTMDLFNPANYWKEKSSTAQYSAERYMLDQMQSDLKLSLESQLSILESNQRLLASQEQSIDIKRSLIKERQNEYQINVTSLYELIQAWNGYYLANQQKADTETTLVNTMVSIDVLTGDI